MELTEEQKRWLFKGEFIELFEKFEEKRAEYSKLTSKLKGLKPGYHVCRYDVVVNKIVSSIVNTYPDISDTLHQITEICKEIEDIEKKLEVMRNEYEQKHKIKITYTELISDLKGEK
ncbi:hypothetical protein ACOL21_04165 [Aliarcobacter butzleri]